MNHVDIIERAAWQLRRDAKQKEGKEKEDMNEKADYLFGIVFGTGLVDGVPVSKLR